MYHFELIILRMCFLFFQVLSFVQQTRVIWALSVRKLHNDANPCVRNLETACTRIQLFERNLSSEDIRVYRYKICGQVHGNKPSSLHHIV